MSDRVWIRPVKGSELATCAEIVGRAWSSALPDRPRRVTAVDLVDQTRGELVLAAAVADDPVGFISVWEPSWFVHHLFVDPAYQRRRIGSRLLGHVAMLADGHPLGLKCQAANRAALRFYERHGFRPTGSRGIDDFGEWVELRTRLA